MDVILGRDTARKLADECARCRLPLVYTPSALKILVISLGLLVAVVVIFTAAIYIIGFFEPEKHQARVSFEVQRTRLETWKAMVDYASTPTWWPAIKMVELETKPDGTVITWSTDQRRDRIGYRTKEEKPPALLVREIVNKDLPFGGTWTFELEEVADDKTRVIITEDGFVTSAFFRGFSKLFFPHDATLKDYQKHFVSHLARR